MFSRSTFRPGNVIAKLRKMALQRRALSHRERLGRQHPETRWIGVTGSCGKSTTCRILAEVLASDGVCRVPNVSWNYTGTVPLAILQVGAEDRYVVQEIATHVPGSIQRISKIFRPQIGVVMNVGTDHYTQFGGQDEIAHEKADLVRALPADGIAVLNADDPRVAAMADATHARVVTFGIEKEATYTAREVVCSWPARASFILEYEGEQHRVDTGLVGAHSVPNVLASLAAAHEAGMALEDAIGALRGVEPIEGRMSEVMSPDGVTFIRDDYKAPWWALPLTADFLRDASAVRKVLVLGEMSDNPGDKATKFRRFINSVLDDVDLVVVVGPAGRKLNKALLGNDKVKTWDAIGDVNQFFSSYLRADDLVVVKGVLADHLERLARARTESVGCWRNRCGRRTLCSGCDLLGIAADSDAPMPS